MSDFMLLGILRMPIEADGGIVAFTQFRSAAMSAAERIEALTAERDRAEDELYELQQTCITLRGENEALTAELQASNELGKALEEDAGQLREEVARLREVLTALHKQALMLRGEQSYREFARAVEKQARAALKGDSHE